MTDGPVGPGGRMSEQALVAATGHDWDHWLGVLDQAGAAGMEHGDIVRHLERHHPEVDSGWWRQSIAVGYERARGLRAVGQTADGRFQIGVRRTVGAPVPEVWALLVGRPGIWLGPGAPEPAAGATYRVGPHGDTPGTRGEVRVFTPEVRMRLSWHPDGWVEAALLQLTVTEAAAGRTTIGAHMEGLPDTRTREVMRAHWRRILADLAAALEG